MPSDRGAHPGRRVVVALTAGLLLAGAIGAWFGSSSQRLGDLLAVVTRRLPAAAPPLLAAILDQDVARVRAVVASGVDPNVAQPLSAEVLRRHGATIDAQGDLDSLPLVLAAFVGQPDMVEVLLELGANPQTATPDGAHAIHIAADLGHDLVIEALLRHGVAVDVQAANGMTPLMMAAREGRASTVEMLLQRGAVVEQTANAGETALIGAIEHGSRALVRTLLAAGASPERGSTDDGLPPLILAVARGRRAIVEQLVAAGADPAAVRTVSSEALMDLGADTEPGQRIEVTPLMLAAMQGYVKTATMLLRLGAQVDVVTHEGMSALLVAILESRPKLVEFFLAHGANPNGGGPAATPLLVAIDRENAAIAEMLLAAGADPNGANEDGLTPLRAARQQGLEGLAKALEKRGANAESAAQRARAHMRVDTLGLSATASAMPVPPRLQPLGLALDAQGKWIYWSEYGGNRILRAHRDGTQASILVDAEADGPYGIGLDRDSDRLCWASDSAFPRRVRCRRLSDGATEILTEGASANLPRAVAVGRAGTYWTEAVSGRVRLGTYGKPVVDLITSGISSTSDRADHRPFESLGLALDEERGWLLWSEFTLAQIELADLEGRQHRVLFDADDGLSFPAGVALDGQRGRVYWADVAHEAIFTAPVEGGPVQRLLGPEHGLIEPQAVAVDPLAGKIYWTDASRDLIGRADLDGSHIEELLLPATASLGFRARPQAEPTGCAEVVATETALWSLRAGKRIATCLEKIDAIKAVKRAADDASWAVPTCSQQLDGLDPGDPDAPAAAPAAAVAARIERACGGSLPASLRACGGAACADAACLVRACRVAAWHAIGARFSRTAEWLEEVRPFVADAQRADVRRVLARIDEGIQLSTPSAAPGRGVLPATGLRTSYRAHRRGGAAPEAVAEDGRLRVGQPMRFVDHADGTIRDQVTGLQWEKKCDGCAGLHDVREAYRWSGDGDSKTVWDWLADVNREGGAGFAGYADWRLPNVKELQSLIDYERFNPAVGRAFDGAACGLRCGDVQAADCSCTAMSSYWSSTTFADGAGRAFVVMFHLGLIGDVPKEDVAYVRAVRGGVPAP